MQPIVSPYDQRDQLSDGIQAEKEVRHQHQQVVQDIDIPSQDVLKVRAYFEVSIVAQQL